MNLCEPEMNTGNEYMETSKGVWCNDGVIRAMVFRGHGNAAAAALLLSF